MEREGARAFFVFEVADERVYRNGWTGSGMVEARRFAESVKMLKVMVHQS
jgi:hypothetical protein